jgi:hypothetical protein
MSTKPINYFKGVLTNKDLTPKTVFMSPAKQDLVRERQYLPEEYVWEDSVVRGVENGGPQRSREEAQCATGRKSAGASPRKAGGNAKYEIPLHRRAKVRGIPVCQVSCAAYFCGVFARWQCRKTVTSPCGVARRLWASRSGQPRLQSVICMVLVRVCERDFSCPVPTFKRESIQGGSSAQIHWNQTVVKMA